MRAVLRASTCFAVSRFFVCCVMAAAYSALAADGSCSGFMRLGRPTGRFVLVGGEPAARSGSAAMSAFIEAKMSLLMRPSLTARQRRSRSFLNPVQMLHLAYEQPSAIVQYSGLKSGGRGKKR